jgi:hypothetical protein
VSNKPVATASVFSVLLALCGREAGLCGSEARALESTAAREAGGCSGASIPERSPLWTNEPRWTAEPSWTPSQPHWTPGERPWMPGEPSPSSPGLTPPVISKVDRTAAAGDETATAGVESPTGRPPGGDEPAALSDHDRLRSELENLARIRTANNAVLAGAAAQSERTNRLARSVIDDIAHGHPDAVLAKMQHLQGAGGWLSPDVRDQLLASIERQSESVAARVARALDTGQPLNTQNLSVIVADGQLALRRDIESFATISHAIPRTSPWPPDREVLYIDTRLLVSREPLMLNTSVGAASWAQVPGVKLVELNRDTIGELPDRLVERVTGRIAQRSHAPMPETGPDLPPLHIVLVQQCQPQPDATAARSRSDAC